jgi:hypothetical protein
MFGFTYKFSIHDLALVSKAPIFKTLFSYMKSNHEHASLNTFTYTIQIHTNFQLLILSKWAKKVGQITIALCKI